MINRAARRLLWSLFGIYTGSLGVGIGIITYNNLVFHGAALSDLLAFNIPFLVIASAIAALLLTAGTRWRLQPVWRVMQGYASSEKLADAASRLIRLPYEIFWGFTGLIVVLIAAFHFSDFYRNYDSAGSARAEYWIGLADNMLSELVIGVILSLLFFVSLRRLSGRYMRRLRLTRLPSDRRQRSFMKPLLLTYFSGFVVVVLGILRYVWHSGDETNFIPYLFVTFMVYFSFAIAVYLVLTKQFSLEVRELAGAMKQLLRGDRSKLHGTMTVMSDDEIGQLASVFNEMQAHIANKYETVERELRLAAETQRQLLPAAVVRTGRWDIISYFEPASGVGGDLYDIVQLDDSRTAVLIGDVSGKGMPAALLMSAAVTLFRSEVRNGGGPGEVVTRLNRVLTGMLEGEMVVTLGLAVFDSKRSTVRYASAGHVAPYIVSPEGVAQLPVCSLPAGIDSESVYSDAEYRFDPESLMVLYTDGVVESLDIDGEMLGFERFESLLQELPPNADIAVQSAWIVERLPGGASPDHDDRALLLVRIRT